MANLLVLGLVKFLHDLFTAIWIGGLVVMAAVIMPSVKGTLGKGTETKNVMTQIKKQMNRLVWVSIFGLLITGMLLSNSSPLFGGILSVANEYSILLTIKHIAIALMVIIVIIRGHVLTMMKLPPPKEEKLSKLLMVINLILGLVVLLLSGLLAATSIIEFAPAE